MGWQINRYTPQQTLDKLLDAMRVAYIQIPGWIAGCTTISDVVFVDGIYRALNNTLNRVGELQTDTLGVPEFRAYAESQYGVGFDAVAEWLAWRNAAQAITTWCEVNNTGTLTSGQARPTIDASPLRPLLETLQSLSEDGTI